MKDKSVESIGKERIFSPVFLILTVVSCLVTVCLQMTVTAMPLLIVEMGVTTALAGSATTVCTIAALLFRPVAAKLADHAGGNKTALAGAIIYVGVFGLYMLCRGIPFLMVLRAVQGVGMSMLTTALGTMVTACLPPGQMTQGMGYFGLGNAVAISIGPSIGLWLTGSFDFNSVFIFGLVTSIFIVLMLILISNSRKQQKIRNLKMQIRKKEPLPIKKTGKGFVRLSIESGSLHPSMASMLIILCQTSLSTYLSFWGALKGIEGIGIFFSLNVFGMIISRLFVGKISRRFGEGRTAFTSACLIAMAYICIAAALGIWSIWLAGILYGFGYGIFYSLLNAAAVRKSTPENRGTANSVFFGAKDLGTACGALIWGAVLNIFGYMAVYILDALLTMLAAVWYLRYLKSEQWKWRTKDDYSF